MNTIILYTPKGGTKVYTDVKTEDISCYPQFLDFINPKTGDTIKTSLPFVRIEIKEEE